MIVLIGNISYIFADYILEKAPIYSKGCRSSRILVKTQKITDFIYARKINDVWTESDGKSVKFDKVFIKSDIIKTIPEFNNTSQIITDDNGIEKAPDIIYLNDHEKFHDNNGNIIDIETRGIRQSDKIYFKVNNVAKSFNINRLRDIIIDENKSYINNKDYKYFICVNPTSSGIQTNKCVHIKPSIIKKELFLTYEGILRVLFTTRNNKTTKFIKWATQILFSIQMGTDEQRDKIVSNIKGVSYETIQELFSINARALPCVYLTSFNTVDKLKDIMNLNNKYSNSDIVYKFGLTKSFEKRKNGHKSEYKELEDYIDMKLVYYTYIDPLYISQAETELKNLLNDYKFEWNKHDELLIIPNNMLKFIKKIYENIGMKYSGHTQEFMNKINELERIIDNLKTNNKYKEIIYEEKLKSKDLIINNYQKDIDILKKELYIKELELKISKNL